MIPSKGFPATKSYYSTSIVTIPAIEPKINIPTVESLQYIIVLFRQKLLLQNPYNTNSPITPTNM